MAVIRPPFGRKNLQEKIIDLRAYKKCLDVPSLDLIIYNILKSINCYIKIVEENGQKITFEKVICKKKIFNPVTEKKSSP